MCVKPTGKNSAKQKATKADTTPSPDNPRFVKVPADQERSNARELKCL
jgi:hypothetical protein